MSDVWQGPGWWLASDGKWYPADGGPEDGDSSVVSSDSATVDDSSSAAPEDDPGWQEQNETDQEAVTDTQEPADSWTEPAIPVVPAPEIPAADMGWTNADPVSTAEDVTSSASHPIDSAIGSPVEAFETAAPTEFPNGVPPIPDVPAPDSSTVAMQDVPPRTPAEAIERDEAWRKPGDGTVGDSTMPGAAPEVVDLAIPEEPVLTESASDSKPNTLLLSLAALAGLALLVFLLSTLFGGDDDPDETETDGSTSTTATTEADGATSENGDPDTTNPEEIPVFELRGGDCIQGEIGSGQVQRLVVVDCDIPHEFEVYREALIDSTITDFDEEAISAQAEQVCRTALAAYIPESDERNLKFKWFQPTEESWNQPEKPDRVITCLLFDEDGPLTGRAGDDQS